MPSGAVPGNGRLRLGVSSCLLGEQVRFDGGHKHDRFLTDRLGRYVERHCVTYVLGQTYLTSHPQELMLRNHV